MVVDNSPSHSSLFALFGLVVVGAFAVFAVASISLCLRRVNQGFGGEV
jgi:hypothetical protein